MKGIVEKVMARAAKVAQTAEVFLLTREETPVHFEANKLKSIRSSQSQSLALRIFKDGRIGYATTNNLEDVEGPVRAAVETSVYGAPAAFSLPGPAAFPEVSCYDTAIEDVLLERMVKQGEQVINALVKHTPGLLVEGGVESATHTIAIQNTEGLKASYRRSAYSLGFEGVLTRGTDMLFVADGLDSCQPLEDVSALIQSLTRQLDWAAATAAVGTRKMPAIFTPLGVASALLAPLTVGFNGKMVLEGASPLGDKLGHRFLSENFSLADDATLPFRPGNRPFDDEGVPSRRLPLVEKGVVTNFYYDLRTAALAGKHSTGHGERPGQQPAPTPAAFVIPAGQATFTDMLNGIEDGIVIDQLMGASQGNILGGDFSGNVLLGYRVEHGKIVGRVKDTVVSGNVYELLKDLTALGADGRWVGGNLFTPSLFFPALSVASRK
jgi:PmbA protein